MFLVRYFPNVKKDCCYFMLVCGMAPGKIKVFKFTFGSNVYSSFNKRRINAGTKNLFLG